MEEFDIVAGSHSATVRKLLTPRGQLVEIASDSGTPESSTRIRVDALGLESLSWQTEVDLVDRLGCSPPPEWDDGSESQSTIGSFEINNEYADVVVSKITTSNGDALVVRAPVKRTELRLYPAMLRELTTCKTDLFSEFLETPHGPHDH
ncbi:hypothetical protein [Halegenticoccus tardaugens]|uniref:hypothetical protein n=1 Tax=Halegenticoccus tardaugens TaxID=2071624 RepID=UPI00100C07DB|nr:hypothetical protein [Halegenticoccus tardaugens]